MVLLRLHCLLYACVRVYVCVYVCLCLENVFHTPAMFCLFFGFIKLSAGMKTVIMAMPVPRFPLLLLILYYVMYYM